MYDVADARQAGLRPASLQQVHSLADAHKAVLQGQSLNLGKTTVGKPDGYPTLPLLHMLRPSAPRELGERGRRQLLRTDDRDARNQDITFFWVSFA